MGLASGKATSLPAGIETAAVIWGLEDNPEAYWQEIFISISFLISLLAVSIPAGRLVALPDASPIYGGWDVWRFLDG